ncbi:MAG: hypothetical protein E7667_05355 [Ruminococcaceae bacterium]|nr:hypothetical protein [Oscillospiraceae bacterium]
MQLYNFFSMLYISTVGKIIENLSPMNWDTIKTSLNVLWKGMLAIFVVIFIIIIIVKLIQKIITAMLTPPKDEK